MLYLLLIGSSIPRDSIGRERGGDIIGVIEKQRWARGRSTLFLYYIIERSVVRLRVLCMDLNHFNYHVAANEILLL